ncbi:MAG: hypothetical protein NZ870_00215 [bacterium]|nr:hypothetical protein [bacterium]
MLILSFILAVEAKFGGVIFTDLNYTFSEYYYDGSSPTLLSFDVSRIYLNADIKFLDNVKGFLQIENNIISKEPATNRTSVNDVYLKNAEVHIKKYGFDIRFGLIPTPWRGYEEKFWKHRFVSKVFEDIELGIPATDRGIRLIGKLALLEYDVGLYNGEGTKSNETNVYKDTLARFAVDIIKTLKLNLFYLSGRYGDGAKNEKEKFFYGFSFENKNISAMGTIYSSNDKGRNQIGYSIHSVYNLTKKHWLYIRFDSFDPNNDLADDLRSRFYFGFGYKIADGVRAALNYLSINPQKDAATTRLQNTVSYNLEVKF